MFSKCLFLHITGFIYVRLIEEMQLFAFPDAKNRLIYKITLKIFKWTRGHRMIKTSSSSSVIFFPVDRCWDFFLFIFLAARVCWPLLCLFRPYMSFEGCLNPMYLVFLLYFFLSILLCSVSGFALSIGWVLYIPGGDTSFMFEQNFSPLEKPFCLFSRENTHSLQTPAHPSNTHIHSSLHLTLL